MFFIPEVVVPIAPVVASAGYDAKDLILIITALSGMFVAIITAWRTGSRVDKTNEKVDNVTLKVDEVHKVTNENFSKQREMIASLHTELDKAGQTIAASERTRATLATEVATRTAAAGVSPELQRAMQAIDAIERYSIQLPNLSKNEATDGKNTVEEERIREHQLLIDKVIENAKNLEELRKSNPDSLAVDVPSVEKQREEHEFLMKQAHKNKENIEILQNDFAAPPLQEGETVTIKRA